MMAEIKIPPILRIGGGSLAEWQPYFCASAAAGR